MGSGTVESLRERNATKILSIIWDEGQVTRSAISRITGLSVPTVNRLVNQLVHEGLLVSSRQSPVGPGRPASLLKFNPGSAYVVGVDVGEEYIRTALANLRGQILATSRVPTQSRQGRERAVAQLVKAIAKTLGEAKVPSQQLSAIAVGVAGTIDKKKGIVQDAPNITGWQNFPLKQRLAETFIDVSILIENDINLAAIGEHTLGVGQGYKNFVFLSFRKGIGAGLIINGDLFTGHTGISGEVGFMAFTHAFSHREAGGLGHLEVLAGGKSLLSKACEGGAFTARNAGEEEPSLEDLYLSAKGGNEKALEVIEEALTLCGVATANIVSMLDPELIVIGGDATLLPELSRSVITEVVGRLAPRLPIIDISSLGQDAVLQGAVSVALGEAQRRMNDAVSTQGRVP